MNNTISEETIFSFGESVLYDGLVGSIITITILTLILYAIYKVLERFMKSKTIENRQSILNIIRGLMIIVLVLSLLSRFKMFEGIATALIASSGIIALIVGVAAQDTIGNLVSGIMVVISKPFIVGDLIKINGEQLIGFVEEITLRHTIIRTYESNRIIVPNNEISKATIENANLVDSTKGNYFSIPVAYSSDIDLAVKIIEEECEKHPDFIDVRTPQEKQQNVKPVVVRCIDFGQIGMMLRCTINSANSFKGFEMLSDLRFTIKKRFDKEGIEIPHNQTFIKK
ncbi:small conductance mechanosensitive channel [Breznakia sp. PF5-3]|uniref:mechanosensitive ion channel family protein n=1 Tax=unclassified Breznakia TaxID=2623764 RepID=UPI0024050D70|nr:MULTISPECIES: mechanosensitive ion channel domain-containing protein [unclassified Breznakia]MDF9824559.1 small conductance mechanosensitive channel [Breznakia sp. PM6-1]MDF9835449.1 small conductance mechanosensitive channel [Breznakia sp. PF5-3]MDF9838576.1 small conductance mechanosensitive channel [Breznakia sp. PFB2-8]MDF9860611.1 small conductance mechanosensitive channel [Breznakia sp. PH5-24]